MNLFRKKTKMNDTDTRVDLPDQTPSIELKDVFDMSRSMGMGIGKLIAHDFESLLDDLNGDVRNMARDAIFHASGFAESMMIDLSQENQKRQAQNLRHCMNSVKNNAALEQFKVANKMRATIIKVLEKAQKAVFVSLAI